MFIKLDEMKIGILTFHTPINYGAALQAYALQRYLRNYLPEAEVQIIDFKTEAHIKKYQIFGPFRRNLLKYFHYQSSVLLRYSRIKKRFGRFKKFAQEEFNFTKRFHTPEELLSNVPAMDVYIVGSDQVFHPSSPYYKVFYMGFPKGKAIKMAYAPSFGMSDFNDDIKKKIQGLLADFDALSCREKDGAQFLSEVVGKTVPQVVDPTFLLSIQQWQNVAVKPAVKEKYIFIYDLNGAENLINIANEIKKKTGYKIICQTQTANAFYKVDTLLFETGPKEMLGWINGAEYVVTDSFHGVAFSVLFRKQFFTYVARPKAASRVRSLLTHLGLQDNIVENGKSLEFKFQESPRKDYEAPLAELIGKSEEYLKNALKLADV